MTVPYDVGPLAVGSELGNSGGFPIISGAAMADRCLFSSLKVPELRKYLKDRDINTANYTKKKLIELAEHAEALEIDVIEPSDEAQAWLAFRTVALPHRPRIQASARGPSVITLGS